MMAGSLRGQVALRYEQQWTEPGAGVTGREDIPGASGSSGSGPVQSVDRAVAILEILARDGEAGVTEVARELGVQDRKSVV